MGLFIFDEKNDWFAGVLLRDVFNPENPENVVLALETCVLNSEDEVVVFVLNDGNAFWVLTPKAVTCYIDIKSITT